MAFELLGPSLADLQAYNGGSFSLKTTLLIADQMLQRVEDLHAINFVHRDIKPDNYCIGINANKDMVYMIDFGLAKRYSDPRTGLHIKYQSSKELAGTARYVSINSHLGLGRRRSPEQGRRDDLESIGYCLMYMLRGDLPWQGLESGSKAETFKKILECKLNTPLDELCKGFPPEFEQYLKYCRNLRFEESPDYVWMKNLFKNLYFRENPVFDNAWDWSYIDVGRA
jgi:serine/threonine protein kinase